MKKIFPIICICVSLIIFVSASVWEGAATTAREGELPETGLYIATNSFPLHTVVDITNLENGKTARLLVTSGLDSPGLLATLSKDAANSIGLQSRSLGRIRMSQSADQSASGLAAFGPAAFSRFGGSMTGDADHDPAAFVALNDYDSTGETGPEAAIAEADKGELIVDLDEATVAAAEQPVTETPVKEEPPIAVSEPVIPGPDYSLTFVPADTRPPSEGLDLDTSFFIAPVAKVPETPEPPQEIYPDSSMFIKPVAEKPASQPPPEVFPEYVPVKTLLFSAPLISSLEKGKYYLQIGAYSKTETVESEISKIDKNLPVAIMNAGSEEKPVYRILIGPVNLGESGALLQRFRASYKDAFVRQGS